MPKIQLNDQINIEMKKIASDSLKQPYSNLLYRIRRTVSCLPSKTHQLIGKNFI